MRFSQAFAAVLMILAGCSSGGGSGCQDAKDKVSTTIKDVCSEEALKLSPFCRQCSDNHYNSTTGASDCKCTVLNFDQDFCSYSEGEDAKPATRAAILEADRACPMFTVPTEPMPAGG